MDSLIVFRVVQGAAADHDAALVTILVQAAGPAAGRMMAIASLPAVVVRPSPVVAGSSSPT